MAQKPLLMARGHAVGDTSTRKRVNVVTPASAVPEISAQRLQNELLGKYSNHGENHHSSNRLIERHTAQHSPRHGRLSSKQESTMKGNKIQYRPQGNRDKVARRDNNSVNNKVQQVYADEIMIY